MITDSLTDALERLLTETPYQKGVLDTLRLLGLTGKDGASGKVARMFLDVLRAHQVDGIEIGLDWESLDGPAPRGVDVIRAIEKSRLSRVEHPTPARIVRASQAVFKRDYDAYLMQYDDHAKRYQPVGGKQEPDEDDPTVTLRREICEELNLPAPPDHQESILDLIKDDWVETSLSATYGLLTQYTFSFFHVVLARFPINTDDITRWLNIDEIIRGTADDQRMVSPILLQALGIDTLNSLSPTQLV